MQQGPPQQGPQGPPWQGPPFQGPPWMWPGRMQSGMRWRAVVSILMVCGWLVFILLYAAFYAWQLTLFQNIVVFFASIVVVLGVMGAVWAAWGMRWMDRGGPPWH